MSSCRDIATNDVLFPQTISSTTICWPLRPHVPDRSILPSLEEDMQGQEQFADLQGITEVLRNTTSLLQGGCVFWVHELKCPSPTCCWYARTWWQPLCVNPFPQ